MQNERHNHIPLLPSASHLILAGNSGYFAYTPGSFARQPSTAHLFGQKCSRKFCEEEKGRKAGVQRGFDT
jgi:hypothetical protein